MCIAAMKLSQRVCTHTLYYPHRFKHLQLTATRSTNYEPLKSEEFSSSSLYSPREVTDISQLSRLSVDQLAYRELDTVGIVVCTCSDHVMSHDPEGTERQVDDVYIADSEGCLMVVRFWGGLKVHVLYSECVLCIQKLHVHVPRICTCNSCKTLIEMHGRMHPN